MFQLAVAISRPMELSLSYGTFYFQVYFSLMFFHYIALPNCIPPIPDICSRGLIAP